MANVEEIAKAVTDALAERDSKFEEYKKEADEKLETLEGKVDELSTAFDDEKSSHEATREALVKTLDRIADLEKAPVRSSQENGQDSDDTGIQKSVFGPMISAALSGKQVRLT